jgi:hypothetical protein
MMPQEIRTAALPTIVIVSLAALGHALPGFSQLPKIAGVSWQYQNNYPQRDGDRDGYNRDRYRNVLSAEDQRKYDSYYQRWQQYRGTNNNSEMRSMEGRMQSIMKNYNIPLNTPYGTLASSGGGYGYPRHDNDREGYYGNGRYGRGYQSVLAPEWQQKFDSYYQRWLQYRTTNNSSEMRSMEGRMQSIMKNYNIPLNTPYDRVASPNVGGGRY